jgi:hypothetical protein
MKTSRNDPCPCGSGKKYKACCMARDQARAHARSVFGEEAFDQAEAEWLARAREQKEWAVDVVPAPGHFREAPDGTSLAMVMAGEWVAHTEVLSHRPAGVAERARDLAAAVNAAARALGVLPERVEAPNRDVVAELGRQLEGRGITVEVGSSEHLAEAIDTALAHADPSPARGRMTVALTWRETEATPEELRDFHEAAAAFFTAAPWNAEATEGPLLLELPREDLAELGLSDRTEWAASVMGAMGESFGVVLHSQPDDLADILTANDPLQASLEGIGFALTVDFDRKSELTRTMQREIAAAGWPVAGPRAYPRLFGMGLPDRWIRPHDVRLATLALQAITVHAHGGDPVAETGVAVRAFDPEEEEEESRLDWFNDPDQAVPIRAEGPGVAEPTFVAWNTDEQRTEHEAAERARIDRFAAWLREQGVPDEEMKADLENADSWRWWLASVGSAGAVTEYDLRLFLYDIYARKTDPTPEAAAALPRSMRRIVRWLEEREEIRYPFAAHVLDELDGIVARGRELGESLEETLRMLSYDLYDDLDIRDMLAASDGWPDLMKVEVAQLRDELQRRWLLWYDELVRGGLTDFGELEDALLARQRDWENTPHPRVDGRTPAEVVAGASG